MTESNGDGGIGRSLTDLMTSLAVIFILLFVSTLNNRGKERQAKLVRTQNLVVEDLSNELVRFRSRGVLVQRDPRDPLIVRIITPEQLLNFELNKANIPPGGREFLAEFAPVLVNAIARQVEKGNVAALVVEGHTDKTGSDETNLPLSQRRATEVSLAILGTLAGDAALKASFVQIQSTAGRGSAEPVEAGAQEQLRSDRSRRVVFRVRLHAPEQSHAEAATTAAN